MHTDNPLSSLRDIHLPPAISDWPPAPGWWIFGFVALLFIFVFSTWIWHKYKNRKPKIEALKILKSIQKRYYETNDQLKTLSELSHLIRRTSLTFYKKEVFASIHGYEWLEFLDETGETSDFTKGEGSILGIEIYKKNPKLNIDSLFPIVKRWIDKTP